MYGIMAVHEGHAYIGMVEGLSQEISEVIHHTIGRIGLTRTAYEHISSPTTLHVPTLYMYTYMRVQGTSSFHKFGDG